MKKPKPNKAWLAWLAITSASAAELATGFNPRESYRLHVIHKICELDGVGLEHLAMALDTAND